MSATATAKHPSYTWIADWAKVDSGAGHAHHGIVVDRDGTILSGHASERVVQRFDKNGKVLGKFAVPVGETHCIALGKPANPPTLWIADVAGHQGGAPRVVQVDFTGKLLAQVTKQDLGYGEKENFCPTAVAVDDQTGEVIIADGYGSSRVHILTPSLTKRLTIDGTTGAGQFSCPHWVWIDRRAGATRLYVADRSNDRIQVFTMDGAFIKVLNAGLVTPSGFAGFGDYLVVAELKARVLILDREDKTVAILGAGTAHVAKPGWPNRKLADGTTIAPKSDIPVGEFNSPHGICADPAGNIYVSEWLLGDRYTKLERVG
jgi:DNA-binding beta-propeller fold protein YncE